MCPVVRPGRVEQYTSEIRKSSRKKLTVIIPMKTEALWLASICYHSLSQSMGLSVLAACLYPHSTSMHPFSSRNTVYIYCLRHISRVVPTLLKIEYMDYFVSINNSVIPTKKVNSELQRRDTQAPERCKERVGSLWGMWTKQMLWG